MSMTTPPLPRPNYTLTDAAKLVGVSRSTIRRRREEGKFPNAFKSQDKGWMIPLMDLLADGLSPSTPTGQVHDEPATPDPATPPPTDLAQAAQQVAHAEHEATLKRLAKAEHELELERVRREGTEQVLASERNRANALERALLMIEEAKAEAREARETQVVVETAPAPERAAEDDIEDAVIVTGEREESAPPAPEEAPKGWWKRLWEV